MAIENSSNKSEKKWKAPVKDFRRLRHDWGNTKTKIMADMAMAFRVVDEAIEAIIIDTEEVGNNKKEVQDEH